MGIESHRVRINYRGCSHINKATVSPKRREYSEPASNKTMNRLISGIMRDPGEGHAFLIGLGDGVAFSKTDWGTIELYSLPKDIKGELHYYKIGLVVGRLLIIGFVTGMLDILI